MKDDEHSRSRDGTGDHHACAERRLAGLRRADDGSRRDSVMESVESQIAEWRAYVANAPGVNGRDIDELEDHLRGQIAELNSAGLADDEAFLVAVKRMGDLDDLSRVRTRAQRPAVETAHPERRGRAGSLGRRLA